MKLNQIIKAVAVLVLIGSVPGVALAGGLGGLDTANSTAVAIRTGVYTLVGSFAGIYLLYMAVMAYTEKKTWADFGWGVVYTFAAGGSVSLAAWGYALSQGAP